MIDLLYNVALVFMMAIMGYLLISAPVSEKGAVRAIEYPGSSADDTMEILRTLRTSKAVDDKKRRSEELLSKAVEKAISDQSGSMNKVKEVTDNIRNSEKELVELLKFARVTEELLKEQERRLSIISQIVSEMATSAGTSFDASTKAYENLIGELNQTSIEISETSESASGVREWFEGS